MKKVLLVISLGISLSLVQGEEVSYTRDIQPILSENCFFCHGPDASSRKPEDAPLRLDLEEFAFEERLDGPQPIIPGDPEGSYIIQLMESDDPTVVMPLHPSRDPAHGKIMKAEDIALVKEWIRQGAEYEPHWAYLPIEKAPLPQVGADWVKNPIDHFVAAQHQSLGLSPSPQQNTNRLLRRLYLDVIGVPPTPDELGRFLMDSRPFDQKWAAEVDALLNTDKYAEHQTRYWMDVARYADTQGIHHDHHRSVWPYRDWLIKSFRENKPFDQFTIEQLAGDLLPDATPEQKIATGYLRVLATSGEGGLIPEEYNAIYAQDRVDAMAAAWLGLTTNCASCHDHKFDQLSTKEVYELTAFFRNNTMNPFQKLDDQIPPYQFAPHPDDAETYKSIAHEVEQAEQRYSTVKEKHAASAAEWLTSGSRKEPVPTPQNVLTLTEKRSLSLNNKTSLPLHEEETEATPMKQPSFQLKKEHSYPFPADLGLKSDQPFTLAFQIKLNAGNQSGTLFSQMEHGGDHRGWDVYLEEGRLILHLINKWPEHALKVSTLKALPLETWFTVNITYDGSGLADGVEFYLNSWQQIKNKPHADTLKKGETIHPIDTQSPLTINGRKNGALSLTGISLASIKHFPQKLTLLELLNLSRKGQEKTWISPETEPLLTELYYQNYNPETQAVWQGMQELNKRFLPIKKRGAHSLIYGEADEDPFAHILVRGAYSVQGEKVFPNTPAVLPPLVTPEKAGAKNRLDLAQWLVRADHPLTARVTVNRYWSYLYGRGFLKNNADFGVMGGHPSHPELLDWLARDFIDSGWDLRHLLKTIVTSATYQQSSNLSPEAEEKDPLNIALTRGPRFRLDAEQLRDQALSVSQLLTEKVGGPSVKPYQPEGHWLISMPDSNTRFYTPDQGGDLYRRSLYTYWKRQATHPAMDILNAPIRETFCVQRGITNTPMQALTLMNEPLFFESARNLAQHALEQAEGFDETLDFLTLSLLSRAFSPDERAIARETYDQVRERFQQSPESAEQVLTHGESPSSSSLPPVELASITILASQLMNLDEAVTK